MISKQSKGHKKKTVPPARPQPEVDSEFDEEVDREMNLHSPQVDDFETMVPLSGTETEVENPAKEIKPSVSVEELSADDISYMLSRHREIDASDITIRVDKGEVILTGSVPEERMKFMAAEVIKLIHGVKSVSNQLKHTRAQ
jgi:hypothetical protein